MHRVLRGSFDRAKVGASAANTLSIHLGGASFSLEEQMGKGKFDDGNDTLHFTLDLLGI